MDSFKTFRFICFILLFAMCSCGAGAEEFTNAIQAYLQHYVHAQLPHGCIVVGLVDEPMTFDRDGRGAVTSVALHYRGQACLYRKISDVPPKAPEPIKSPVIVNLGTNVLDACAGHYEVAPGDAFPKGLKMTVWREGTQLLGRAQHPGGDRVLLGAFPLLPESETNFFEKLTGAQFRFTKNEQGQVTALAHHYTGATLAWFPDWEAKKLK